jgi:hypothetical protein
VPHHALELSCDQLSHTVDAAQFERMRWARDEAPKLARLVELALAAVAQRPDFELADEGSGGALRRFIVKVHGFRVMALALRLIGNTVSVQSEPIERSKYILHPSEPVAAEFEQIDSAWMAQALGMQFARIQV